MKKTVMSFIVTLLVIGFMTCGVVAASPNLSDYGGTISSSGTAKTTLVYLDISEDYTVTIPAAVVLGHTYGNGKATLSVVISKFDYGATLYVNLSNTPTALEGNYDHEQDMWVLKHAGDDDHKLYYYVNSGGEGDHASASPTEHKNPGDPVLSFTLPPNPDSDQLKPSTFIHCAIDDYNSAAMVGSGRYEGVLTFEVNVVGSV